jgi:hypothetical protein
MQNRVLTVCCLVAIILIIAACGAPAGQGAPQIQVGTHAATGQATHAATGAATRAATQAAPSGATRAATSAATAAPTVAR